jgi:hypothetical protein
MLRMAEPAKSAEARRILERYVLEVVVAYDLCPWARVAWDNGEVSVEVLLGTPGLADWLVAARRLFGSPTTRVAMIVAPELAIELPALRELRDRVAAQLPEAGVAEFHPRAALDLATPARLVPFLRRSPDPMLQLVPLALLDRVRASPLPDRAAQAQILAGTAVPSRDVGAQIAHANHATVTARHAEIEATLADIAADRAAAYARVGITGCAFP